VVAVILIFALCDVILLSLEKEEAATAVVVRGVLG
jgi:hypothetical protein